MSNVMRLTSRGKGSILLQEFISISEKRNFSALGSAFRIAIFSVLGAIDPDEEYDFTAASHVDKELITLTITLTKPKI